MKPVELTEDSFKGYGRVLHIVKEANLMANDKEVTYWSKISEFIMSENISTGILIGHSREPIYTQLERHFNTPEIIVALDNDAVFIAAKPTPDQDAIKEPRAFLIKRGEAVMLYPATWHYVPCPVNNKDAKYLIIFANNTESTDLFFKNLEKEIVVEF